MNADRPPLSADQLRDAAQIFSALGMLQTPPPTDPPKEDKGLRKRWNTYLLKREERRTRRATMDTRAIVLEQFDNWRLVWGRARHVLSGGVAVIWAGLTMTLFSYMWHVTGILVPSWLPNPSVNDELLAGMFVAWSAITTAAHRALRPSREKNDTDKAVETAIERIIEEVRGRVR